MACKWLMTKCQICEHEMIKDKDEDQVVTYTLVRRGNIFFPICHNCSTHVDDVAHYMTDNSAMAAVNHLIEKRIMDE